MTKLHKTEGRTHICEYCGQQSGTPNGRFYAIIDETELDQDIYVCPECILLHKNDTNAPKMTVMRNRTDKWLYGLLLTPKTRGLKTWGFELLT